MEEEWYYNSILTQSTKLIYWPFYLSAIRNALLVSESPKNCTEMFLSISLFFLISVQLKDFLYWAIIYYFLKLYLKSFFFYAVLQLKQIMGTSFIFIVLYIMPDFKYIYYEQFSILARFDNHLITHSKYCCRVLCRLFCQ